MYFGSLNRKDTSPEPYDVGTKKVPVSKESQAPENLPGKNSLPCCVVQSIHDIQRWVTKQPYLVM